MNPSRLWIAPILRLLPSQSEGRGATAIGLSSLMILLGNASVPPSFGKPPAQVKELRVGAFLSDPPGIDALSKLTSQDSSLVRIQYTDPLIFIGDNGEVLPALATSWKNLSPTRWEFTLRKGVRFHNGEEFNAEVVKFSADRLLDPKAEAANAKYLTAIKSVIPDSVDPLKVIIETHTPDGMFPRQLMFLSMLPPQYLTSKGLSYFQEHPIGTGPFKLVEWKHGKEIVFEKNPNYWNSELPKVERMKFVIASKAELFKRFKAKELDFLPYLDGRWTREVLESGESQIQKRLVLTAYYCLLKNQGPLANPEVRRALNYALDKDEMIRFADYGNAAPLPSMAAEGALGRSEVKPYPFDLKRAKEKLAAAGYAKGFRLRMLASEACETIAKIMRTQLHLVGVKVELEVVPRVAYKLHQYKLEHREQLPDYDLVLELYGSALVDISFLGLAFFGQQAPFSLLRDTGFEVRFSDALQALDSGEHEEKLKALDRYFHDQALSLFTTQRILTVAARRGMKFQIPLSGGFHGSDAYARVEMP